MTDLSKANITRAILRYRTAKTNAKFRSGEFSGFESSPAILEAVEDVSGWVFDLDDLDGCFAYRLWSAPTPAEKAEVIMTAWNYAEDGEGVLHWGAERLRRPAA